MTLSGRAAPFAMLEDSATGCQKRRSSVPIGVPAPALYDSEHFVWPVKVSPAHAPSSRDPRQRREGFDIYDVHGPICESTDRLAAARALPPVERGDLLAIFSVGAYGMVMASQYNAVPRWIMSCIAQTVSSIGVLASGRWQKTRST